MATVLKSHRKNESGNITDAFGQDLKKNGVYPSPLDHLSRYTDRVAHMTLSDLCLSLPRPIQEMAGQF